MPLTSVCVETVTPKASERAVRNFFAICGPPASIELRKDAKYHDGMQQAIVTFDTEDAASMAVRMSNSRLLGRSVTIAFWSNSEYDDYGSTEMATDVHHAECPSELGTSSRSDESTATEKISSLFVAASTTIASASSKLNERQQSSGDVDESKLTETIELVGSRVKGGAAEVGAKARELDERYDVSGKAKVVYQDFSKSADRKARALDEQYGVSDKVTELKHKALSSHTVVKGISMFRRLGQSARKFGDEVRAETERKLAEKKEEEIGTDDGIQKVDQPANASDGQATEADIGAGLEHEL